MYDKWHVNTALSCLQLQMVDKKLWCLLHKLAVIFMTSMRYIGARVWRKFLFSDEVYWDIHKNI